VRDPSGFSTGGRILWPRAAAELNESTFADGRYVALVGVHSAAPTAITVRGPRGSVTVEGSPEEIARLVDAIRLLDGSRPLRADALPVGVHDWNDFLSALDAVGALLDLEDVWHRFHRDSSNPNQIPPDHDPMEAYQLARWAPAGENFGSMPTESEPSKRASADLLQPCNALRSFQAALELAAAAYELHDGHRPAASGGALYPLHLWVVGSCQHGQRELVAVDHDRQRLIRYPDIEDIAFRESFIADPGVDTALENGAAVILVAADSRRMNWKYGSRGYRYILIETGAVMHDVYNRAMASGVGVRAVAGFFDDRLNSFIDDALFVTLTLFIAVS
jgi:SagB-type dehydrogenase family enzyme